MKKSLSIGVAGLGTVGTGVVRLLQQNAELIAKRAGQPIHIFAVNARDQSKERDFSFDGIRWIQDAVELATHDDIDVFVELIGGKGGIAKVAVEKAIESGKHVVTANKALLAIHGQKIAEAAEAAGVNLRFEAAVAGGIPVVKALTESLAGDQIRQVLGVMNGTCNYILTRMESSGKDYEDIFKEATELGYLEADPNLDVGGIDAGHKLALLASIAFGSRVDFNGMDIEGIGDVTLEDIKLAGDMGYRIKLLCVARMSEKGLEQRTKPCLVPAESPLGQIENATNIVVLEGVETGQIFLQGAGAGQGPTASAVLGDLVDIARGRKISTFGQSASSLLEAQPIRSGPDVAYYVRLRILDEPGVLAKIAAAFGDAGVSIHRVRQYGDTVDKVGANLLIVTHRTSRERIDQSLAAVRQTGLSIKPIVAIRIENV